MCLYVCMSSQRKTPKSKLRPYKTKHVYELKSKKRSMKKDRTIHFLHTRAQNLRTMSYMCVQGSPCLSVQASVKLTRQLTRMKIIEIR